MAFVTEYAINLKYDSALAAEKQWKAQVLLKPTTSAATATAPADTTGPLGADGDADALRVDGAGNSVGFGNAGNALQKAVEFIMNDLSLNGIA